ncbi:alpha/beta-hydrolase [Thozetella sp. PMI_491]|nr:alpha/beta-hydrolase [Thozetella sp. PMI_491]
MFKFTHPQLGELTGRLIESSRFSGSAAVQFRSIPYATVPARFLPSTPLDNIPLGFDSRPHRDFVDFGAACPQPGGTSPRWFDPYGGPLEDDKHLEFNEFTCLSLTISVPASQLGRRKAKEKLPVMVYIHGGGAQDGMGHVDGLHSNAPLASFAASISQPVITVNIGYRLNWLGSLVCQDMLDEYSAHPTSPLGPFNLSLQDQRNAFAWIHKYIEGFGGDVAQICAFGESAGSIFLVYHICGSSEPLFQRVILQSGMVIGDLPLEEKEAEYQSLLKYLNIEHTTAAERLEALRKVDCEILSRLPGSHMTPYVGSIPGVKIQDSLFTRGAPTSSNQRNLILTCKWLGDMMVGDTFWEGDIFAAPLRACPVLTFVETVRSLFPSPEAEELLDAYRIPIEETPDMSCVWIQMSMFLGDMIFSAEYDALARAAAASGNHRNVYRYSFALSNPFPGSGHSFVVGHHFVDILFVFLTLVDRYPTRRNHWLERQACETARRWILFANGEEPWSPFFTPRDGSINMAKIAVCDDITGWTVRTLQSDEELSKGDPWGERRYTGWKAFAAAFHALRNSMEGDGAVDKDQKVNAAKLKLLQLSVGPLIARVPSIHKPPAP